MNYWDQKSGFEYTRIGNKFHLLSETEILEISERRNL